MKKTILYLVILFVQAESYSQKFYPFDTTHWSIESQSYVLENFEGEQAIYIQNGSATLKGHNFKNGTVEVDIYLTERQAFPGIYFHGFDNFNAESFFLRPHLSGKPDANQAAPIVNGLTAWQLYFGPSYSFAYDYNFNGWTHVKLVVSGDKAQVFLDYSEKPNLSWILRHGEIDGNISIGGSFAPMHFANFFIDPGKSELIDFSPIERDPIEGLIQSWEISDMFEESDLDNPADFSSLLEKRKWGREIQVEEGVAANISRQQVLYNGEPGNTVLARVKIQSDLDQLKLFEFGYSDRVIAILNNQFLYWGNNKWRSRDYRYLGTVGLFDAVYLDLKKGENILYLAVSEDFGGWLVTGRLKDPSGLKVKGQ